MLDGVKQFISGAGASDLYLVMARTGEGGAAGVSAFLVEKDTPGLSFGAKEKKMGWRAQPTRQVILEGVRVPAANLVGVEGGGFKIAMAGLDGGRLNIGACSIGGGQSALDKAIAYMRERKAFGRRIADFQALQFRVADIATSLETARSILWRAASALDENSPDATRLCARRSRSPPTPASTPPMTRCNCSAATAISPTMASRSWCAISACTRSWKERTRSCG